MTSQEVPAYFNNEFFEKILKRSLNFQNVTVQNKHIQLATKPGDNYTSEIYRAKIEYIVADVAGSESQHLSLIIKNMPDTKIRGEVLDSLQAYDKEVEMYCKTLPAMSELLGSEMFCAKCFYTAKEPCNMMIFQDLYDLRFKLADRLQGLDFAHCRLVMRKIGKFHAASMVLAERQPNAMKLYNFGIFNLEQKISHFERFFVEGLNSLIENVAKWPGYESITAKLQKIQPNFIDRIYSHVKTDNDKIRVLNHGDLWTNNMMFTYNGETPKNVMFVDYQLSFYSTPGIDLNYFLWTCPSTEVRKNHWSDLVREYYNAFLEGMVTLKAHKIPSFEDIKAEILNRNFYGFVSCVSVLPLILMERQSEVGSGMDAIMNAETGAKIREITHGGAKYQEAMKYNLKCFDQIGVLD